MQHQKQYIWEKKNWKLCLFLEIMTCLCKIISGPCFEQFNVGSIFFLETVQEEMCIYSCLRRKLSLQLSQGGMFTSCHATSMSLSPTPWSVDYLEWWLLQRHFKKCFFGSWSTTREVPSNLYYYFEVNCILCHDPLRNAWRTHFKLLCFFLLLKPEAFYD